MVIIKTEYFKINRWSNIKSKLKTILFCTIFNLFFELSLRGITELLIRPILFIVILIIYLTLFIMLEDFITRYKFEDKHVVLFSSCYGTLYFFISSNIYSINPWFFGVNLGMLLFVSIVWWAFYQTLFPLYLSHRLFSRDWNRDYLSKAKWIIALGFHLLANFLIVINPATVIGTPIGYITTVLIAAIFAIFLIKSLKNRNEKDSINLENQEITELEQFKILDILGIISFILMSFSAIFLILDPIQAGSSRVNATALTIIIVWTFIVMITELFILIFKRKIPV